MLALTQLFQTLAEGTGRPVPPRTVQLAVRPLIDAIGAAGAGTPGITSALQETCGRLGLTLTAAGGRLEQILALAVPRRPLLLVVDRGDRTEFVAIEGSDGPTIRVQVSRDEGAETRSVLRSEALQLLELDEAHIEAAFRLGSMGATGADTPPLLSGNSLSRLWHFLAPDRTEILLVVGFAIGLGLLTLATPIAVQSLVNFVAFGGLMQPLIVVGLLLLFFLAFAGAIRVFKFYVVEILQRRVFVRVVSDLSARLPRVRLDARDRGYGPELVNRFFDVLTVQKAGSTLLIDGLDVALQAGIGLMVLAFYHPLLLVFDVALIVAIAFILFVLGRGAFSSARRESSAKYEVAGALEDLARAPITYKLSGAPEYARAQLAGIAGDYITARRAHYSVVMRQVIGAVTLHAVAGTALLTLGGFLVIRGQLTLGQLVAAELIVSVALLSLVKFGKQLETFYDLVAGADKLGMLFDLPLEQDSGEAHTPTPDGAAIELRRVTYEYPDRRNGIRDFSLRIERNERVAIRGPRGSGKSTLAELITGLRTANRGVVLFDDVDLREIANASIRSQVDLVSGPEFVRGTVLDNVRLGRSDVSMDQIRDALDRFGILRELLELPDGVRSGVSTLGAPLSEQAANLLMLARATVGRPRAIVIDGLLDELDTSARERALSVLTGPEAPWTLIVFTARDEVSEALDRVIEIAPPPRPGYPELGANEAPEGGRP